MAFLWLPIAQNILQVQAFGSLVGLATGLNCTVVGELEEFQSNIAQQTSYSFDAEVTVPGFCTGPITFIVPSETPNFSYSMYSAWFDEAQSVWIIHIQKSSRTILTFPTMDVFPNFSLSPLTSSEPCPNKWPSSGGLSCRSLIVQTFEDDTSEVGIDEIDVIVSSDNFDAQSISAIEDASVIQTDVMEEQEEEQKVTTATEEVSRSWAEEMNEEDERNKVPVHQPLPPIAEEPEPPEVSTGEMFEQDDIEPLEQGSTATVEDPESNEEHKSDEAIFQEMIDELEDPWKPNLRAFVPEDITEGYNYFSSQIDTGNPKQPHANSRKWHVMCKGNAEWRHMHIASVRIRQAFRLRRPLLEESQCDKRYLDNVQLNRHEYPAPWRPSPYLPDDITHHRNMLGRCVNTRSTTPIEISFWATHSPALRNKFLGNSPLLHRVCASRAAMWVDPFYINTHVNLWNGSEWITGSASVAAMKGVVERVYLYNDLWRNPEDAKARSDVPTCVGLQQAPVKPVSPPVVDYTEVEFADTVVNDDGRVHMANNLRRKESRSGPGPSKLRDMQLCYESAELSDARKDCAKQELGSTAQDITEILTHQHVTPPHEEVAESTNPIIVPAHSSTRRILRPRSARLTPRVTPRSLPTSRDHVCNSNRNDGSDDESEAETEIIVDNDESATTSHFNRTGPAEPTPSNHMQAAARVSEWLEIFADVHPLNDEVLSPLHADEGPVENEGINPAIEDEFLPRLSEESPQNIITTEDDDSGHDFSFDKDEYSPIMQVPDSPTTDVSAYNGESSEAEHEDNRKSFTFTTSDVESDRQPITADLTTYRGSVSSNQEFRILPSVLALFPTFVELSLPKETNPCHMHSSTELILYRPPVDFRRAIYLAKRNIFRMLSQAIEEKARSYLLSTSSQVITSGPLAFGRNKITVKLENNGRLSPPVLHTVTATADIDTTSISAPSQATPIIHNVDLPSIPIIPFNDISEIPTPSPSAPERFYGKINIAIGRAAIKTWKFLTPSSRDWSISMGSAGEDDGYLWDRHNTAWDAFQFA